MAFAKYEKLRDDILLFALRGLQVVFAIVILGVTAQNVTIWGPEDCTVPPKLAYNVAAVSKLAIRLVTSLLNNSRPL
jgi:hypothetical protein